MKLFGNILDNIQFKGGKTNVFIKWFIGFATFSVFAAFMLGQIKIRHQNKLEDIESLANKSIKKTEILEMKVNDELQAQNLRIDNIYDDGIEAFNEYRQFNNEQMRLIIDYGHDNKELLKKMLKLNSRENAIKLVNDLKILKNSDISNIIQRDTFLKNNKFDTIIPQHLKLIEPHVAIFTESESSAKTYYVLNAPPNYIDTLDLNRYEIIEVSESKLYKGLYNYIYKLNNKNKE